MTDLQVYEYKCTRQSSHKLHKWPWLPLNGWEGNGREREGGRFACVVHSIRLMKNAGKVPRLERLARISCLCFIFGCCHGYWWKEMKLKRWREADRLGDGRNGENNLNSQASGKIYCWRFWLPIPLRILYIQTSTLKPITFRNKAPWRTALKINLTALVQFSLYFYQGG